MCSSVPRAGGGPLSRSASARLNALSQRERERERAHVWRAGEGRGSVSRVVVARSTDGTGTASRLLLSTGIATLTADFTLAV